MKILLVLIGVLTVALIITLSLTIFDSNSNNKIINSNDNKLILSDNNVIDTNKTQYIGNFHTHTDCSDGEDTYDEMIQESVRLDFDFIAITDHEICPENQELCANEKRILCIPSQEVSTNKGHILAIDISEEISDELSIEEVIKEIHNQNGIAIAAHPLREGNIIEESKLKLFDAIECNHPSYDNKEIQKSKELAQKYGLNCTYDSDAHSKNSLKNIYNICEMNILNVEQMKKAIKNGNCHQNSS